MCSHYSILVVAMGDNPNTSRLSSISGNGGDILLSVSSLNVDEILTGKLKSTAKQVSGKN